MVLFFWRLVSLGKQSQDMPPQGGLENGVLKGCDEPMHCVSSSAPGDSEAHFPPLSRGEEPLDAYLDRIAKTVRAMGGEVKEQTDTYLRAEFTSRVMGFVDDFEAAGSPASPTVQVRSESRVGKSDMGVNRKRLETLKNRLSTGSAPEK